MRLWAATLLARCIEIVGARKRLYPPCKEDGCFDPVLEFTGEQMEGLSNHVDMLWIVAFYADWCPHCQNYAPVFKQLGEKYKDYEGIRLAAIDCAAESICDKYDISGYPEIRMFHTYRKDLKEGQKDRGEKIKGGFQIANVKKAIEKFDEDHPHSLVKKEGSVEQVPAAQVTVQVTVQVTAAPVTVNEEEAKWQPGHLNATQTDHLWDAFVAVFEALTNSLFLTAEHGVLPDTTWNDALTYVGFMAAHFPNESLKEHLLNFERSMKAFGKPESQNLWREFVFKMHQSHVSQLNFEGYVKPLEPLEPRTFLAFSSCGTYTCRQWTLFHVMATTFSINKTSAKKFFHMVHIFRDKFFGCQECMDHALKYLTKHENDQHEKNPTIFFWEFHNAVTKRVRDGKRPPYPPKELCASCWDSEGQPVNEQIRYYLDRIYDDNELNYFREEFSNQYLEDLGMLVLTIIILFVCLALAMVLSRYRNSKLSKGRVKKISSYISRTSSEVARDIDVDVMGKEPEEEVHLFRKEF